MPYSEEELMDIAGSEKSPYESLKDVAELMEAKKQGDQLASLFINAAGKGAQSDEAAGRWLRKKNRG
jgi:hypothetical protein